MRVPPKYFETIKFVKHFSKRSKWFLTIIKRLFIPKGFSFAFIVHWAKRGSMLFVITNVIDN